MVQALQANPIDKSLVERIVVWMGRGELFSFPHCFVREIFLDSWVFTLDCICLKNVDKTHQTFVDTLTSLGFEVHRAAQPMEDKAVALRKGFFSKPSPEQQTVIDEFSKSIGARQLHEKAIEETIRVLKNVMPLTKNHETKLKEAYGQMHELLAPMMSSETLEFYTSQEMEGCIAHHKTPIGQKALELLPRIVIHSQELILKAIKAIIEDSPVPERKILDKEYEETLDEFFGLQLDQFMKQMVDGLLNELKPHPFDPDRTKHQNWTKVDNARATLESTVIAGFKTQVLETMTLHDVRDQIAFRKSPSGLKDLQVMPKIAKRYAELYSRAEAIHLTPVMEGIKADIECLKQLPRILLRSQSLLFQAIMAIRYNCSLPEQKPLDKEHEKSVDELLRLFQFDQYQSVKQMVAEELENLKTDPLDPDTTKIEDWEKIDKARSTLESAVLVRFKVLILGTMSPEEIENLIAFRKTFQEREVAQPVVASIQIEARATLP